MAPGDSTVVELNFSSRTYKTVIKKYATIYSNDPVTQRTKIHLEVEVDPEPDSALYFNMSDRSVTFNENRKKAEIEIVSTSSENIILHQLNEPMDGLKVKLKKEKIKPGKKSKISFEWNEPIGKENVNESITFSANDSTFFSIPVFIAGTDPTPTAAEKRKAAAAAKRKEALKNSKTDKTGDTNNTAQKPGTVRSVRRDAQTGKEIPVITKEQTTKENTVTKQKPVITKEELEKEKKDDSGK